MTMVDVQGMIDDARAGTSIELGDIARLSMLKGEDREELFATARDVRDAHFGKKVFIYGFAYFSTHCRNNCSFCYYRRANDLERYRKSPDEVVELSHDLKGAGVNLVDLTMGEDPRICSNEYSELLDMVKRIKDEVGISVMVSPGAVPRGMMSRFRSAGADWFACYQETYNRDLFSRLRLEQDFDHRVNQRAWARESGILAEDGMMVGLGESAYDRAEAILNMGRTGCEQIRAMTFVPQHGTPMSGNVPAGSYDELTSIAVMRILFPDRFIPASLDVEGIAGLETRIDAGANVITSIVPPNMDLAGVAQHDLDIDNGNRSVDNVLRMLSRMGRHVATNQEYESALSRLREGC